jgi:hypothetical protein
MTPQPSAKVPATPLTSLLSPADVRRLLSFPRRACLLPTPVAPRLTLDQCRPLLPSEHPHYRPPPRPRAKSAVATTPDPTLVVASVTTAVELAHQRPPGALRINLLRDDSHPPLCNPNGCDQQSASDPPLVAAARAIGQTCRVTLCGRKGTVSHVTGLLSAIDPSGWLVVAPG